MAQTQKHFVFTLVFFAAITFAFSQAPWATLKEPPTALVPAGDVLSCGHLGRQVGNVELILHFYHDLLGLKLLGPREQPRPFGSKDTNPALLEFAQLGQGVPNPMDARNRAVLLPIPGTASKGANEMTVEAIESGPALGDNYDGRQRGRCTSAGHASSPSVL